MKSKINLLLMSVAVAATASAQNPLSLVFHSVDGSERAIEAKGLKMSYADGTITASNEAETAAFDISSLEKMYFSTDTSSVEVAPRAVEGPVNVFSLDGVSLGRYESIEGARRSLPAGTYVVSSKSVTLKIIVK